MPKRNEPQAEQIGKRIYKKRKEMNLTQDTLAERSGLSQSFLTCVERGEKGLGYDSLIKLCDALGTSADYLLTGVMSPKESNYILSLFEPFNEDQREQAIEIVKHLLIMSGHTPPDS